MAFIGQSRPARRLLNLAMHGDRMRVALVAETFLPAINGVVNSVVRVADDLVTRGHEPVVIAPSGSRFETPAGHWIDVVAVPAMRVPAYSGLTMARPRVDLRPLLAALKPDVVHLASPAVLGWRAARAANDLNIPSIAVFQTDLSGYLRRYRLGAATGVLWAGLRRLHGLTDLTLVPSTSTADQLRSQGIGPLAIWGRGVDSERFNPGHRSEHLNRKFGSGPESQTLVVGFVGRLAAEKRVDLLEPITRLPGVRLIVIGDGPRRESLQRKMPNAQFLGMQTGLELSRSMASLDVLVNPGANETFCQVVQEALASGVPVLAAAAGGPLDLIQQGHNGWLWSGDDPTVLARKVAKLSRNRHEVTEMAGRTRASVVSRTWSRVSDDLIEHYRQVISTRDGQVSPMTDRADESSSASETGKAAENSAAEKGGEVISIRPRQTRLRRRAS
jgi:phosphatidylinositol alpha 1,6-mannosyltransferase